jgi:hypothetical protein
MLWQRIVDCWGFKESFLSYLDSHSERKDVELPVASSGMTRLSHGYA